MTTLTAPLAHSRMPMNKNNSLLRMVGIVPVAALTVAGLFYAMHLMVFSELVKPDEDPIPDVVEIFMEREVLTTNVKELLERPPEPTEAPKTPVLEPVVTKLAENHTGEIFKPIDLGGHKAVLVLGDNQLTPFIRVSPRYPRRALERGTEGFVDVNFDVTTFGGTSNIRIVNAQPEGTFDSAALKAVRKWKYKPQIVDGEPQAAFNLRERIRFRLEN